VTDEGVLLNIILIGFKNSGKTSVAKLIAEKTGWSWIDIDDLIEKDYQKNSDIQLTVSEIYKKEGESYFRDLERAVISELKNIDHGVIAVGGGSMLEALNIFHLKQLGTLIYLNTSFDTLLARLRSQPVPAFLEAEKLEQSFSDLYNQRKNIYKQNADIEILTANKSVLDVTNEIIALMENANG